MVALAAISSPATGETLPACGSRSEIINKLYTRYAEIPAALGVHSNGGVIEILTSPQGTFTIIRTMQNGKACMIAAGEGFEFYPQPKKGAPL